MEVILFLILATQNVHSVICMNTSFKPSFTSQWFKMASQDETLSQINITHDLLEIPVKVIADIKVKDNEGEYIFRGMGGAETDDDRVAAYGGVLVIYDEHRVMLIAPKVNTNKNGGKIIYTGSKAAWNGPSIARKYNEAMVRVRVWKSSDFSVPAFISNWENVNAENDTNLYKEIQHPLESYPDLVNVQIKIQIAGETFFFEGQGSKSVLNTVDQYDETSGAVFGYNDKSVLIWFQKNAHKSYVFTAYDGWGGMYIKVYKGAYRVLAWKYPKQYGSYDYSEVPKRYQMTIDGIKFDSVIVNAQIQVNEGKHSGYRFYAVGSAMHDGGVFGRYGGLIYAITNSSVLMWIPKKNVNEGHIFNIWPDESTNNVAFRIELIWLTAIECPKEDLNTSKSATLLNVTGYNYMDRAIYQCSTHHRLLGGDNYVACQPNSTWSQLHLRCHRCRCPCSNESDDTLKYLMSKTKKELTVDKKKLSAFIRKTTSAEDNRPAAKGMGMAAGIMLIVFVLCIIIPDVPLLYRHLRGGLKNTKHRSKYKSNPTMKKHLKDAESLQNESTV